MKIKPRLFEFKSYKFEPKKRKISFYYRIEFFNKEPLDFTDIVILPAPLKKKNSERALSNLLDSLHIMLGISYYKLYCPPKIKLNKSLSKEQADFFNIVYRKGLGEFYYRNKLDPKNIAKFPINCLDKLTSPSEVKGLRLLHSLEQNISGRLDPLAQSFQGKILLGIGGGKDSIVASELLKGKRGDIAGFLVDTQKKSEIPEKIIELMGIKSLKIYHQLDEKIYLSHKDSYNGHIPVSAIIAFLGVLLAVLYDYSYVAVGNEYSSNFGNIKYKGEIVNHQWSKSQEFETLFQAYVKKFISPYITYFSLLRPFYEIRIVEMFSKYKKYFPYFTSCNENFKRISKIQTDLNQTQFRLWCGKCPKCAFMFALFSVFLEEDELISIFKKNFYNDNNLLPIFNDLLGFGKLKPFDCVGTFEETQAAFYLAQEKFKNTLAIKTFLPKIYTKVCGQKNYKDKFNFLFKTNDSPTLPTGFKFSGIKNVLILGYGKEGQITHKYLEKNYPNLKISIADKKDDPNYLAKQDDFDLIIKTPGIPKKMVTRPYTTATNIFFSEIEKLNFKSKEIITIGITGSKGKSTTSSLIYSILKEAGKNVFLLGNIGNPMLEALLKPIKKGTIFVIELSSYQLDDIKYSPNIAIVLNLFPEHMNYHGNISEYYKAKKNIINFQDKNDYFIYNPKDKILNRWLKDTKAKPIPFLEKYSFYYTTSLIGDHNHQNIKAAITLGKLLKIPKKILFKAIKNFKPLPHRLELVGNFQGIIFYDDAISTTPESTIMAIKALKNVDTIFLGGEDRGYNFSELEKIIRKYKIKNAVLFPESGKRIFKSRRKELNILETKSMEEAVKFAFSNTAQNKICLLSTASPSYSLWKNYEEKGEEFRRMVEKYGASNEL